MVECPWIPTYVPHLESRSEGTWNHHSLFKPNYSRSIHDDHVGIAVSIRYTRSMANLRGKISPARD